MLSFYRKVILFQFAKKISVLSHVLGRQQTSSAFCSSHVMSKVSADVFSSLSTCAKADTPTYSNNLAARFVTERSVPPMEISQRVIVAVIFNPLYE
jgi:hypothetical protein